MWRATLGLSLCLSLTVGCAPIVSWRTEMAHHYQAKKAWGERKSRLVAGQDRDADFAHGWKQGYFDSACGSNGAPPPVPPERYWKPYFQTPEGRKRVEAWYEGYHYGAIASEQDGAPELARIPTAPGLGAPPPQFLVPPPTAVPGEEVLPNPDAYGSFGHPTAQPSVAEVPAARTLSTPPVAVPTPQVVPPPAAIAATPPSAAASQPLVPPPAVPQPAPPAAAAATPTVVATAPTAVAPPPAAAAPTSIAVVVTPPMPTAVAAPPPASTAVVAEPAPAAVAAAPIAPAPRTERAAEREPAAPIPGSTKRRDVSPRRVASAAVPALPAEPAAEPEPAAPIAGSPMEPAIAPPAAVKAIGPPTVVGPQPDPQALREPASTVAKVTPRSAPAGHLPAGEPTRQIAPSKRQQPPAPPAVIEANRDPQTAPRPTVVAAAEPMAAPAIDRPQAEPAPKCEPAAWSAGPSKRRVQSPPAVAKAIEPPVTVEEEKRTQSEPIAARKNQTTAPTKQPTPATVVDLAPSASAPAQPKPAAIAKLRPLTVVVQPAVEPAAGPPPAARTVQSSRSQPTSRTVPQMAETKKTAVQAQTSAVRMVLRGDVRPQPTLAIVPPASDVESPPAISRPAPAVVLPPQPASRPPVRAAKPIAAEPVAKGADAVGPAEERQPAKAQEPTVAKKASSAVVEQPARVPAARPAPSPAPLAAPTSSLAWRLSGPEQFVTARPSQAAGSPGRAGKWATLDGEKPLVMALDYGPSRVGTLRIVRILELPESAWALSIDGHSSSGEEHEPIDLATPKQPAGGTLPGSRGAESSATRTTIRYR